MFKHILTRRGLSLERLHVLLELDRAGSLVKAADGDEVRQSQYSRQLKQLSEYFGCPLAERNGRELKLTDAGRRLAILARESFTGLDDFRRACENQPLALTLGAGDSILQWVVIPRLGQIQSRLSNVQIILQNLRNSQIAERLSDLTLEFGLLREGAVPPRCPKERLFQLRYSVFVPYSLMPKASTGYKQVLQELPLVRHNPNGELSKNLESMAHTEGIILNHRVTCESFPQAFRAVQSGHFAAVLPTIAGSDLKGPNVAEIEWPALKAEARWIVLSWNPKMISLRSGLGKVRDALLGSLRSP